jgi:hypothetical protein
MLARRLGFLLEAVQDVNRFFKLGDIHDTVSR